MSAPLIVEVIRSNFVESRHRGHVIALDADGGVVVEAGDVQAPMLARSSAKPLQATAMIEAGWVPADDAQLALGCASHSGEPMHTEVVRRILEDARLEVSALQNTPALPMSGDASRALIRAGGGKDSLHQSCSGKHASMLATCVANGWPIDGYLDPDHPVQRAVRTTVERLSGETVTATAVDGCGAPLFATSLIGLGRSFAALASSPAADAMRAHPELVGGTGRDVTAVMRAVPGLMAKDGADGVYAAALPDGRAAAVKVEDGAGRARGPLLAYALERLGVDPDGLAALRDVRVLGHGVPVGELRVVPIS